MELVSSSSFFHYTKSVVSLLGILHNGFRFSYCFEPFDEFIARSNDHKDFPPFPPTEEKSQPFGISFPMVCFCDIPLKMAGNHRNNYGDYCIGLSRNITLDHYSSILNPVFYVNSFWVRYIYDMLVNLKRSMALRAEREEGLLRKDIESVIEENAVKIIGEAKVYKETIKTKYELDFAIEQLLRLTKPYIGENGECYYDEREWRVFWDYRQKEKKADVHYGLTREVFNENRDDWNKRLETYYLTFEKCMPSDVITHIIVPKEKDIPQIIGAIKSETHVLGNEISMFDYDTRELLISKVTSFERIENDY